MKLGKNKDKSEKLPFGNVAKEIKILGVYFALDVRIREEVNYKEILGKIKRLHGWWKQRNLTVFGKILLLKTYALCKLNCVFASLVVPKWVISEIQKIRFEFIWERSN